MPAGLLKACSFPGCGELSPTDPCHAHQRRGTRATATQRGYGSGRWRSYSQAWLRRFPVCGMRVDGKVHTEHSECAKQGVVSQAEVTDHIKAVRLGGDFWDATNHQSLCQRCNKVKAIKYEGGFGRVGM